MLHVETHIISLMTSEVVPQLLDLLPLLELIPGFLVCMSYLEKVLYYLNSRIWTLLSLSFAKEQIYLSHSLPPRHSLT